MTYLLPTNRCFDNALDLIEHLVKEDPRRAHTDEYLLVHGICLMPSGEEYAHAWVEHGDRAIFSGIVEGIFTYCMTTKAEFYEHFAVKETTKYTMREAWEQNCASNHYGPWVEKYRALCGDAKRAAAAARNS